MNTIIAMDRVRRAAVEKMDIECALDGSFDNLTEALYRALLAAEVMAEGRLLSVVRHFDGLDFQGPFIVIEHTEEKSFPNAVECFCTRGRSIDGLTRVKLFTKAWGRSEQLQGRVVPDQVLILNQLTSGNSIPV